MKTLPALCALMLAASAACSRTVYTPVESATNDSLYRSSAIHDTIMLLDSVRVEIKGDSVKETRQRIIYRTVTLTDTVRSVSTDTVRVIIPPDTKPGDTSRWRLPAILAALLLSVIAVRKITKG
ncbi:MAG: hypothetical protein K2L31_10900 [Muribaculum sp.]|nr:hypothetical protein [Muribaculum sp.]